MAILPVTVKPKKKKLSRYHTSGQKKEMPFGEIFRYSGRRKVLFVLVKVLPI